MQIVPLDEELCPMAQPGETVFINPENNYSESLVVGELVA